jgi:fatty-acid peroxygenase
MARLREGTGAYMAPDLSFHLWRAGYRALPEQRSHRGGTDVFETSLLGRRAAVVRGRDGARLFYDPAVVEREGAVPPPVADLLFGRGAVHGLDGDEHAKRKAMFLDILTERRVEELAPTIGRDLERRAQAWPGREVAVFDELVEVYGAAVQAWAGIEASPATVLRTSRRLASIVNGFGGAGLAYPRAWAARLRADRWARRLIESVREGSVVARPDSVLSVLSVGPGRHLDARVAGVELLNILRPTVAVAWPGTFLARDLATYPQWRALLRDGDGVEDRRTAFGHEVRRTCPFVPALVGRVHSPAEIDGIRVAPGDMLVLDVPAPQPRPGPVERPGRVPARAFRRADARPIRIRPSRRWRPVHRAPLSR